MQILSDAGAVVVLFLIALKVVPPLAAIIAGVLAAISPQFAYSATLLLPDSLVALPILLAVYFAIRGLETKQLANFIAAGALVGVSCWHAATRFCSRRFLQQAHYVYIIHYFFLILAGYAIARLILLLARRRGRKLQTAD